jgi:hypothetical protein
VPAELNTSRHQPTVLRRLPAKVDCVRFFAVEERNVIFLSSKLAIPSAYVTSARDTSCFTRFELRCGTFLIGEHYK